MAPQSRIFCLARLIRWPTVASGISNARAISAVVRPPTARRVSATCDPVLWAGWAQSSSKVSESSTAEAGAGSGSYCTASSRRRRAVSLRSSSIRRREATVISHPRGLTGTPPAGHCWAATSNASWTASSQVSKSPKRRTTAPRTCGAHSRSRSSR